MLANSTPRRAVKTVRLGVFLLISLALEMDIGELLGSGISDLVREEGSRKRLQERITQERITQERKEMQRRLEEKRQYIAGKAGGSSNNNGSQDAETRAKYQSKSLARGGRCVKIFVSMILDLFAFRNFALSKELAQC